MSANKHMPDNNLCCATTLVEFRFVTRGGLRRRQSIELSIDAQKSSVVLMMCSILTCAAVYAIVDMIPASNEEAGPPSWSQGALAFRRADAMRVRQRAQGSGQNGPSTPTCPRRRNSAKRRAIPLPR